MQEKLEYIIDTITKRNVLHGKKLKNLLTQVDINYRKRAELFFERYERFLIKNQKTLDFAIDCYLQMLADVSYETIQFVKTGQYSNSSFEDVNERVYNNPELMTGYLHGLILRQFLFPQNYKILMFFNSIIKKNENNITDYLEIGGGHGLFLSEALSILNSDVNYTLIDISKSALDFSRAFIDSPKVTYIASDVFKYKSRVRYDFITMGEVLEHVENPVELLKAVKQLLKKEGKLFITTVTNAPAIDHVYLFRNAREIREVIVKAGFSIKDELDVWSEDMPPEKAEKMNISMMYAALLTI